MAEKCISEMEARGFTVAHQVLAEPLKAVVEVLNLATKVHANDTPAGKLSKVASVKSLLLQRTQNDLRCCMILVERGYPLQAVAQAASIFEAWVTIANIETEEDAVKWLSHDKENESFGSISGLIKQTVKNTGNASGAVKLWYSQYQQLCMAKHLNPILERNRGYVLEGNVVQFRPGPDTSDLALRWGWIALERASQFAILALLSIVQSRETSLDLELEFVAQQEALKELQEKAAKRWPDNYLYQN